MIKLLIISFFILFCTINIKALTVEDTYELESYTYDLNNKEKYIDVLQEFLDKEKIEHHRMYYLILSIPAYSTTMSGYEAREFISWVGIQLTMEQITNNVIENCYK